MAAAAERAGQLARIYFVPAPRPGHREPPRAAYADRFAMVALALANQPRWLPLAVPDRGRRPTYAVDQLDWIARSSAAAGRRERYCWIVGADAFLTLPTWKNYRELLQRCDFLVLGRDGHGLKEILQVVPHESVTTIGKDQEQVQLAGGRKLFWLPRFASPVSATQARTQLRIARPTSPTSGVPVAVAQYARRAGLYNHAKNF